MDPTTAKLQLSGIPFFRAFVHAMEHPLDAWRLNVDSIIDFFESGRKMRISKKFDRFFVTISIHRLKSRDFYFLFCFDVAMFSFCININVRC